MYVLPDPKNVLQHHLEGDAVVHHVHQPLADGGDTHGNAKLDGNLVQGLYGLSLLSFTVVNIISGGIIGSSVFVLKSA